MPEMKASTWNAFIEAALANRMRGGQTPPPAVPITGHLVLVQNNSGAAVARGDVLGIDGMAIEPDYDASEFEWGPVFDGVTPADRHYGKFVVCQGWLADGDVGYASIESTAVVKLNSLDAPWKRADVEPGQTGRLAVVPNGSAQIIWSGSAGSETGNLTTQGGDSIVTQQEIGIADHTDHSWALVRLGLPEAISYCGKADEDIGHGSSGTVSLWFDGTDSGYNVEAELDCAHCDRDIKEDDEIIVTWNPSEEVWRASPTACTETPTEEFTCAKICYWVPECCVYRAVSSSITESEDWCADIPAKRDSIWVVHDLFSTLLPEDFEDPLDYYCSLGPEPMLAVGALGWVKKVADEFTCTYTPQGEQQSTTETLPVYQWCWFKFENCPPKERTMTARTSSADCEDAVGHSTTLSWHETVPGPPENLADCSTAYEWGFANETDCVGIWVGEFEVDTTHQVRLVACTFDKPGEPDIIGWIWPDWCTGEINQLYEVVDGINEPVPYNGAYANLQRLEGCRLLYEGGPDPVREDITYHYRLLVACSVNQYGELGTPRCCVEHITPDCHPYPGEALADDAVGRRSFVVCGSTLIIDYDFEFGASSSRVDSVGWWDSVTEQYSDHRFAGCFNDLDENCDFMTTLTTERWKLTLTW